MKKTVLYEKHLNAQAQMFSFAGFEMPLKYQGILPEHAAVRSKVGVFDVSHMGVIDIFGVDSAQFLDFLATNSIQNRSNHSVTYTAFSSEDGGTIDDLLIFKVDENHFFLIVNAVNRENDLLHLKKYANSFQVAVEPQYEKKGVLALQGPESINLINDIFSESKALKHMHFTECAFKGQKGVLSYTGYTGESGFEIIADLSMIEALWEKFLELGAVPCGLGARDLLRMEMGYPLYGHELSPNIAPTESTAAWAVKFDKLSFIGKEALEELESSGLKRFPCGLLLGKGAVAREGFDVLKNNQKIGMITSGSYSPILNRPIALAIVNENLTIGEELEIPIRGVKHKANIVKLPFIKRRP